jgi:hypothetical protein
MRLLLLSPGFGEKARFGVSLRAALGIFLLALLASYPQKAAADDSYTIRIQIIVKADNGLDSIIRGYLVHSLAEIKDIIVTDHDPDYQIQCVALATSKGYCLLSFVVLSNLNSLYGVSDLVVNGVNGKPAPEDLCFFLSHQYEFFENAVMMAEPDRLRQKCSEFIASFEGNCLDSDHRISIAGIHYIVDNPKREEASPAAKITPKTTP